MLSALRLRQCHLHQDYEERNDFSSACPTLFSVRGIQASTESAHDKL